MACRLRTCKTYRRYRRNRLFFRSIRHCIRRGNPLGAVLYGHFNRFDDKKSSVFAGTADWCLCVKYRLDYRFGGGNQKYGCYGFSPALR